jgi:hypothetical protein
VNYLEKENEGKEFLELEQFFSHTSESVDPEFVKNSIDNNKKGLKDKDAKFYMVSINPSEQELKHIAKMATGGRKITDISQMNPQEIEKYNQHLKEYARSVMDNYAKAFNRDITGKDLVYFGKVEQQRHYNGKDKEVLEKLAKSGELKPGLQTHIHIVVSRKDKTQKMSLSPLANSRGKSDKHKLNGKSVQVGFDRVNFKLDCEHSFDKAYNFKRNFDQSFEYYKFRSNPAKGLIQSTRMAKQASQAVKNPEMAAKNIAIAGIDKLTNTKIAGNLSTATNLVNNPESAKDLLVGKLDQVLSKMLPPEVKAAKKVLEVAVKIVELGTGGLEI